MQVQGSRQLGEFRSCCLAPDGRVLSYDERRQTLRFLDILHPENDQDLNKSTPLPLSATFSRDGSSIAAILGNYFHVWDVASGRLQSEVFREKPGFEIGSILPDGRPIVTVDAYNQIALWDCETSRLKHDWPGRHQRRVKEIAISPDGKTLVTSSYDHTLKFWDLETRSEIAAHHNRDGMVENLCISPDGKTLAGRVKNRVRFWNVATGLELFTLPGTVSGNLAFSSDGKILAAAGEASPSQRTSIVRFWLADDDATNRKEHRP